MAVHSVKKKSINLGSLPVWSGVQNAPGIRRQIPFGFKVEDGLIRLNVEGNLKNTIVENYGNPDYSFITTPPGYSEWGTYLGRQQIGYMDMMPFQDTYLKEKILSNLEKYGNTSAATIPLVMDEAIRDNRIKQNDIIATSGFGAG